MRVLQVIDTLSMGGAQRVVLRLAQCASGGDVDLTVVELRHPTDTVISDALADAGAPVIRVESRTNTSLSDPTVPLRLARLARTHDVVQSHLGTANVVGPIAARLARRPSVATLHTVNPAGGETRTGSRLRTRAMEVSIRRGATCVAAVGGAVRRAHSDRTEGRPVPVITNPAPPVSPIGAGERRLARASLGLDHDLRVLVSVGRLDPAKGLDVLLNAMTRLPDDVVAVIAGSGSLDQDLREAASALGLEERVRFLGNRSDVDRVLATADLFVSSSRREGMPMAILEAMARGLPVVATDVGDVGTTVSGAGIVVPPEDATALADAIERLVDAPAIAARHAEVALDLAERVHGQDVWFGRWQSLWRSVAGRQPVPADLLSDQRANEW